jgi:iron complex transport system permease protein
VVLPASLVAGAAFLVLADTLARTVLPSTELPVGAITGLLGGPLFLWLLRRRQRYSAI